MVADKDLRENQAESQYQVIYGASIHYFLINRFPHSGGVAVGSLSFQFIEGRQGIYFSLIDILYDPDSAQGAEI